MKFQFKNIFIVIIAIISVLSFTIGFYKLILQKNWFFYTIQWLLLSLLGFSILLILKKVRIKNNFIKTFNLFLLSVIMVFLFYIICEKLCLLNEPELSKMPFKVKLILTIILSIPIFILIRTKDFGVNLILGITLFTTILMFNLLFFINYKIFQKFDYFFAKEIKIEKLEKNYFNDPRYIKCNLIDGKSIYLTKIYCYKKNKPKDIKIEDLLLKKGLITNNYYCKEK